MKFQLHSSFYAIGIILRRVENCIANAQKTLIRNTDALLSRFLTRQNNFLYLILQLQNCDKCKGHYSISWKFNLGTDYQIRNALIIFFNKYHTIILWFLFYDTFLNAYCKLGNWFTHWTTQMFYTGMQNFIIRSFCKWNICFAKNWIQIYIWRIWLLR